MLKYLLLFTSSEVRIQFELFFRESHLFIVCFTVQLFVMAVFVNGELNLVYNTKVMVRLEI